MIFLVTPACFAIDPIRSWENGAFGQSTVTFRNCPSMFATQSSWVVPLFLGRSEKPSALNIALN